MFVQIPIDQINAAERTASALIWANMFAYGSDTTQADGRTECAMDFYNLAYFAFDVICYLSNVELTDKQRCDLLRAVDVIERSYFNRFPDVFNRDVVRLGFDGLRGILCPSIPAAEQTDLPHRSRVKDYARATWLRNQFHNVYLAERFFPVPGASHPKPDFGRKTPTHEAAGLTQ